MGRPSVPPGTREGPYCVIAQMAFGCYLRTMWVPEAWIPLVTRNGWTVLVRDTEMPRFNPPRLVLESNDHDAEGA